MQQELQRGAHGDSGLNRAPTSEMPDDHLQGTHMTVSNDQQLTPSHATGGMRKLGLLEEIDESDNEEIKEEEEEEEQTSS